MDKETIDLHVIEDGGNPCKSSSIAQHEPDTFHVTPFSEDNDPNYKFRLEILAINNSRLSHKIKLQINWNELTFAQYRNRVYIKCEGESDWFTAAMANDSDLTSGVLTLPPGKSIIALQPTYAYGDHLRLIEKVARYPNLTRDKIGETAENRQIDQFVLEGAPVARKKRKIVVVCRVHPYETAGSFCAEGIVDAFVQRKHALTKIFDRYRVHLIPMANPDGVFNGFCKRTAYDGIDMSKQIDPNDPTCAAVLAFLDDLRPDIYCEIHNWMLPDVDGIYFLNRFKATRFIRRLPSGLFKPWKIDYRKMFFAGPPEGLKKYCLQKFNSTAFVVEFPWFGRSPADMKTIGAATLNAMTCL